MTDVNGPIIMERAEVVRSVAAPTLLTLLLTDAIGEQYGVPLTTGQALDLAEKLKAAAKQG